MDNVIDMKAWKKKKFKETFGLPDKADMVAFMCYDCGTGMWFAPIDDIESDDKCLNCGKPGEVSGFGYSFNIDKVLGVEELEDDRDE